MPQRLPRPVLFVIMAKEKKEKEAQGNLEQTLAALNKKHGDGSINYYSKMGAIGVQSFPTGSINLDLALGIGGYPRGRIIEIWGSNASGKTTMCLHAIAEAQKLGGTCAFVDAEHALDIGYAAALGVDTDNLLLSQPSSGEQALEIVEELTNTGEVALIVVDSVAALVPQAEIDGEMGQSHMGLQARLMSQGLRKITGTVSKTGTTVMFINQTRMKIGVMFGNPTTTSGGGSLAFYASVRMEVTRTGTVKDGDESLGSETRVKVVKNKVAPPFREASFQITYGKGIDKELELVEAGVKLLLIDKSGSWFSYQGTKLGQGSDKVVEFLRANPEVTATIKAAVEKEWFKR